MAKVNTENEDVKSDDDCPPLVESDASDRVDRDVVVGMVTPDHHRR